MREKMSESKRAMARPISLYPHQKQFAEKRAFQANMSLSRYIQILIEIDRKTNVLAAHLAESLKGEKE